MLIRRSPWVSAGLMVMLVCTITAAFMAGRPVKQIQVKAAAALHPFAVLKPQGNGYTFRRTITIDHTKVPNTDQGDFPVLISGPYSYLATVANGGNVQNANGYDVIFTSDSGCSAQLNHEVETYNAATGAVKYWVKVPALLHATDTVIYMCYGNAAISASQQNATGVWDANFKGIYHLKDGASLDASDSTAFHSLTNNGVTATTGMVDGGGSFDGSTQYLSSAAHPDFSWANVRTVEFWMKMGNTTQVLPRLFSNGDGASDAWSITWIDPPSATLSGLTGNFLVASIGTQATPSVQKRTPDNGTINAANVWHHVAVVGDGTTVAAIYLDGSPVTVSNSSTNITNTTIAGLNIGRRNNDGRYFSGALDELRLSNAQRSADWIKTEYNNQSSPATFYSISPISTTYTYQRRITIDHTKVPNTDQSNFPVLISGTYSDLAWVINGGNVQNRFGYDVIFTSDCNCSAQLDHEVETYSATTGAVNYWVKVPALSHTTDTVIYMCYGNAAISASQQNATGVWDTNFKGIYHLKGSAPDVSDSTTFHSLTNNGATATTGKVDGGGSFDGSTQYLSSEAHADFSWANLRTVEFWMKMSNTTQVLPRLFSNGDGASDAWSITWIDPPSVVASGLAGKFLIVSIGTQATPSIQRRTPDNGTINAADVWHHVAVTGDGATVAAIYLDGSPVTVSNYAGNITNTTTAGLNVGRRNNDGRYFSGALDELRLSNAQRSADWIKTEYNNQSSPATFYSIASNNDGCNVPNQAPTVSLTSPVNNAVVNGPATIQIDANAADPDGLVNKVEFFRGDLKLGEDTAAPYSFNWPNVSAGVYTLTARATDNVGTTTISTAISITVNQPPTVSLISPANNTVVNAGSTVPLIATAGDSDGVVNKVEFFAGGFKLGEDTVTPYTCDLTAATAGMYSLTARATDNSGAVTASSIVGLAVNALPVANAGGPYSGVPGMPVQFSSAGSIDPDGFISIYYWEFGDGGSGTGASPTHTFTTGGIHTVTLMVIDSLGAMVSSQSTATIATNQNARLDPLNQTGGEGENSLSRNFNWSVSLVSLPGRAGLNLGLSLSYNSLVWTKNGSYISFDDDRGFPSPGFRLGFPVIQPLYYNSEVGKDAFMLITPDGRRVELRKVNTSALYEAADSSHLLLDAASMVLRTTDGTQLSYALMGNDYQCTQIKDRNGNFITINYIAGRIDTVVDTLFRTIKFNYTGNDLTSITQDWTVGGTVVTHYWARFAYTNQTIQTNFSGLTLIGKQNNDSVRMLTQVKFADDSHYDFSPTSWGQVWKITKVAADSDTHVLNYHSYNLPGGIDTPYTDCPRFTFRFDWAENWNRGGSNGAAGLPAGAEQETMTSTWDAPASASWNLPDGTPQSGLMVKVTQLADGTYNKIYYASVSAGTSMQWGRGLPWMVETYGKTDPSQAGALAIKQRSSVTSWNQDDTTKSYQLNPRVEETNVYDFNASEQIQNHARTSVTYQTVNLTDGTSFRLPQDVREYAANATTVLRRSNTQYNLDTDYTNLRIVGLPREKSLYEGDSASLMSKVGFTYDGAGSIQGTDQPVQHDNTNYTASFIWRANLTSVSRFDATGVLPPTTSSTKYNTAGGVVATTDASNHTIAISYIDAFAANGITLDSIPVVTLAYPTTVTDPDNYTSETRYNYDFGASTWKQTPKSNTIADLPGPQQKFAYDALGRLERVTNLVNNSYTRLEYAPTQNRIDTYTTIPAEQCEAHPLEICEAHAFEIIDGQGRGIGKASVHPGSTGGFSGQLVLYNKLGQVVKTSNPTETSASGIPALWAATGDDVTAGWLYTAQTYDWKGRRLVTTHPSITGNPNDTTTTESSYSGCGCAGGEVMTMTDEGTLVNGVANKRQQRVYSDVIGRTVKTEILDWEGTGPGGVGRSVYSTTINSYNARDQLTLVREFDTAHGTPPVDPNDLSCPSGTCQQTVTTYDGYGRLKTNRVPEQDATTATTYAYNPDDTIQTVTDARGASRTFTYNNNRHLVTGISYSAPSGITPTPSASFGYDSVGNQTFRSDGSGSVTAEFNDLSQLFFERHTFTGLPGNYDINYEYNIDGQVKNLSYAGLTIDYRYDTAGRVTSVTGSPFAGVTDYVSDVKYRAFGSPKKITYGVPHFAEFTYNSRMLLQRYNLKQPYQGQDHDNKIVDHEYYADGTIRFAHDVLDERFDRAYAYDATRELKDAYTGSEARTYHDTGQPSNGGTGAYRQSYQHDAWNNMTSRSNRFWSQQDSFQATYLNNRNSLWQYDEAGNLRFDTDFEYRYDAAGRNATMHPLQTNKTITQLTDSEGQMVRKSEADSSIYADVHYLRSTVLGKVVAEYRFTQLQTRYVYLGDDILATLVPNVVNPRYENPVTGSRLDMEPDTMGVDVGFSDPYANPEPPPPPPDLVTLDVGFSSRCLLNGFKFDCAQAERMVRGNSALHCVGCEVYQQNEGSLDVYYGFDTTYVDDKKVRRRVTIPRPKPVQTPRVIPAPIGGLDRMKVYFDAALQYKDCKKAMEKILAQIGSDSNFAPSTTDIEELFNKLSSQTGGGGIFVDVPKARVEEFLPEAARGQGDPTGGGGFSNVFYTDRGNWRTRQRYSVVFLRSSYDTWPWGLEIIPYQYVVDVIHEITHEAPNDSSERGLNYQHEQMDGAAKKLGSSSFDQYVREHCIPKKYW